MLVPAALTALHRLGITHERGMRQHECAPALCPKLYFYQLNPASRDSSCLSLHCQHARNLS
jgi:hypothetical protein